MVDNTPGTNHSGIVERLTTSECWNLLEHARLGRLALSDPLGEPELFPVNFTTNEGFLYIRTANDTKLRHLRVRPRVAFEVDGNIDDVYWSVLVRGDAQQVTTDEEIRRSGAAHLTTASPTIKPFFIRIAPAEITGRRFREAGPAVVSGPGTGPIDRGALSDRSTRPNPIPHLPPFEE